MKISIILKPRKSGLKELLRNIFICNYNQWNGSIETNMFIDRVPLDKLENIYKTYINKNSDYKLFLGVSIEKGLTEIERIENLFNL